MGVQVGSPLAVIITVDADWTLRILSMDNQRTELVYKWVIKDSEPGDKVLDIHFYSRAKSIMVITEKGQHLALLPGRQQYLFKGLSATCMAAFERDSEKLLALGLDSGKVLLKQPQQIITTEILREVSPSDLELQEGEELISEEIGKVTCLKYLEVSGLLISGSYKSYLMVYNFKTVC